jgi:hypothetical protein
VWRFSRVAAKQGGDWQLSTSAPSGGNRANGSPRRAVSTGQETPRTAARHLGCPLTILSRYHVRPSPSGDHSVPARPGQAERWAMLLRVSPRLVSDSGSHMERGLAWTPAFRLRQNRRGGYTDRSSSDPRGNVRDGGPPSGGAPPACEVSGTSGAADCERPCAVACVGFTSRTGRNRSAEPIDKLASEVGDSMANTIPRTYENKVNAGAFCPGRRRPIRPDWHLRRDRIACATVRDEEKRSMEHAE